MTLCPWFRAGDIAAAHWYVGATLYTLEEPDKLGFVIPEEGADDVSGGYLCA